MTSWDRQKFYRTVGTSWIQNQFNGACWRVYVLVNLVSDGLDKDLSPVRQQTFSWNLCCIIFNWIHSNEIIIKMKHCSFERSIIKCPLQITSLCKNGFIYVNLTLCLLITGLEHLKTQYCRMLARSTPQELFMRYALCSVFVFVFRYNSILPTSFNISHLDLRHSCDCSGASEVTLKDMKNCITSVH